MKDMGSTQPVRKTISLKLKKPKVKTKSSKSSKSKKEKRSSSDHRVEPAEEERVLKSPRKSKSSSHNQQFPKHAKEELEWDQKIVVIGEKVQDPMIHICEKCSLPVLVYGRLSPCKHVFCLTCAEKASGKCPRCEDRVERIEPAGIGQIFVCSFGGSRHGISGCRRSYLSQRDLLAHIRHRHQRDAAASEVEMLRNLEQQHQQAARMPFFGTQFTPSNVRPSFGQILPTQMPVDNRMIPGSMPPRDQTFMEAPRMQFPPAPAPTQIQGQFQSQPMNQPAMRSEQTAMQAPRPPAPATVGSVDHFLPHSTSSQFTPTVPVSRPGQPGMPPGPAPYPENTGQFMPANIPSSRAETSGQHGRIDSLPPGRIETSMSHGHVEGGFAQSRVDTAPIQCGPVDGNWRPTIPPPPAHGGPPRGDWQAQGRTDMSSGFPGDHSRYPAPYYK